MRKKLGCICWSLIYGTVLLNDARTFVEDKKAKKRQEITDNLDMISKVQLSH